MHNPNPTPLRLRETASQTGGPYVHIGLAPHQAGFEIFHNQLGADPLPPETPGERITIEGLVSDGSGTPIRDLLVESWQADAHGHYAHPGDPQPSAWRGWARTGADFDTGLFRIDTLKPGAVPGPGGRLQAPHIALILFARGINLGLHTRLYFGDETAANEADPVLQGIEWAVRRQTLIAPRTVRDGRVVYRFDIRVQATDPALETVFFDV